MPVSSLKPRLSPSDLMISFTDRQKCLLEKMFEWNKNPNESEFAILSTETGLSIFHIKVWYEHRWATWRQQQGFPPNSRYVYELK